MMEKKEQLTKKRILELALNCYKRDIPFYTEFLTLHEQTMFHSLSRTLPPVRFILTGGYETAERKIVYFLPSYEDETAVLPISIIKASPLNLRFAEELTHRDYLGAIMNLGIERSLIGDILMNETGCFIFCLEKMAQYITDKLVMVRHTPMKCSMVSPSEISVMPEYEEICGSVASARLDNLIALVFKLSRSKAVLYIESEKVFIDGKLVSSCGFLLKGGEIVSVRGLGKFSYCGVKQMTKKGRVLVEAKKYR